MSSINGVDTGNLNSCMGVDVNSISNINGLSISFGVKDALFFDSTYSDKVTLPRSFATNTRTISTWVKPAYTTYNGMPREFIYAQYGSSGQRTTYLEFRETGVLRTYIPTTRTGNDSAIIESNEGQYFNENQWYYISVTIDSSDDTAKMYVDGVLQDNTASSREAFSRSGADFVWGSFGTYLSTLRFNGTLKGLNLWNVSRTESEIVSDMTRVWTGEESNLKAYFPLDEGSGSTITDMNGTYSGTISTTNTTPNYINDVMWVVS